MLSEETRALYSQRLLERLLHSNPFFDGPRRPLTRRQIAMNKVLRPVEWLSAVLLNASEALEDVARRGRYWAAPPTPPPAFLQCKTITWRKWEPLGIAPKVE